MILAFDVEVKRDVQELAESVGVTIFMADIIYHLFDRFTQYRDNLLKKRQEEFRHVAVFPCKLKIMPQYVFNSRDPIVMGVLIQSGFLKEGTPICVPSKDVSQAAVCVCVRDSREKSARVYVAMCLRPAMHGKNFL